MNLVPALCEDGTVPVTAPVALFSVSPVAVVKLVVIVYPDGPALIPKICGTLLKIGGYTPPIPAETNGGLGQVRVGGARTIRVHCPEIAG